MEKELVEALQGVVDQADAQFKVGDKYATFNKIYIAQLEHLLIAWKIAHLPLA